MNICVCVRMIVYAVWVCMPRESMILWRGLTEAYAAAGA